MANDLLMPAQVIGAVPQQQAQMPSSALAAAMMGHGGMPTMQTPQIPLASLMQMMHDQKDQNGQSLGGRLWNGMSNWLNGRQWDGMAGQSLGVALDNQALGNMGGGVGSIPGMPPV